MNIASNAIAIGVAASLTVLATGCTRHVTEREYVTVPTPVQQPAPPPQPTVVDRVTVVQPPAPPHEEMPPAPAATGYSWVPGHYEREDGRWKWQGGQWVAGAIRPMPPAVAESPPTQVGPSSTWIPGYWAMDHGDWVWIKGHWDV